MNLPARNGSIAKMGLVLFACIVLALAYQSGVFARASAPKDLARALVELGGWGYAAYLAVYVLLQPFGVPGTVFVVAAPLIWPWKTAFVLSLGGSIGASLVGFAFARFVARDWVAARIPTRMRQYSDALEHNAFQTVVLLRVIFWMAPPLHFFFGVSKVGFWTHALGCLVGYIPPLLLISYLGGEMFDDAGHIQPGALPLLASLIGVFLLFVAAVQLRRRRVIR